MKPIHPDRLKKQVKSHLKRLIEDTDTPESTPFTSNKLMAINMAQRTPENQKLLNSYASDLDMDLESISELAQPTLTPIIIPTAKSSTLSEYSEYESTPTLNRSTYKTDQNIEKVMKENQENFISQDAFAKKKQDKKQLGLQQNFEDEDLDSEEEDEDVSQIKTITTTVTKNVHILPNGERIEKISTHIDTKIIDIESDSDEYESEKMKKKKNEKITKIENITEARGGKLTKKYDDGEIAKFVDEIEQEDKDGEKNENLKNEKIQKIRKIVEERRAVDEQIQNMAIDILAKEELDNHLETITAQLEEREDVENKIKKLSNYLGSRTSSDQKIEMVATHIQNKHSTDKNIKKLVELLEKKTKIDRNLSKITTFLLKKNEEDASIKRMALTLQKKQQIDESLKSIASMISKKHRTDTDLQKMADLLKKKYTTSEQINEVINMLNEKNSTDKNLERMVVMLSKKNTVDKQLEGLAKNLKKTHKTEKNLEKVANFLKSKKDVDSYLQKMSSMLEVKQFVDSEVNSMLKKVDKTDLNIKKLSKFLEDKQKLDKNIQKMADLLHKKHQYNSNIQDLASQYSLEHKDTITNKSILSLSEMLTSKNTIQENLKKMSQQISKKGTLKSKEPSNNFMSVQANPPKLDNTVQQTPPTNRNAEIAENDSIIINEENGGIKIEFGVKETDQTIEYDETVTSQVLTNTQRSSHYMTEEDNKIKSESGGVQKINLVGETPKKPAKIVVNIYEEVTDSEEILEEEEEEYEEIEEIEIESEYSESQKEEIKEIEFRMEDESEENYSKKIGNLKLVDTTFNNGSAGSGGEGGKGEVGPKTGRSNQEDSMSVTVEGEMFDVSIAPIMDAERFKIKKINFSQKNKKRVSDNISKKNQKTNPNVELPPKNSLSPSKKALIDGSVIYKNMLNIQKIENRGIWIDENSIEWIRQPEPSGFQENQTTQKKVSFNKTEVIRDKYISRYYKSYLHKNPHTFTNYNQRAQYSEFSPSKQPRDYRSKSKTGTRRTPTNRKGETYYDSLERPKNEKTPSKIVSPKNFAFGSTFKPEANDRRDREDDYMLVSRSPIDTPYQQNRKPNSTSKKRSFQQQLDRKTAKKQKMRPMVRNVFGNNDDPSARDLFRALNSRSPFRAKHQYHTGGSKSPLKNSSGLKIKQGVFSEQKGTGAFSSSRKMNNDYLSMSRGLSKKKKPKGCGCGAYHDHELVHHFAHCRAGQNKYLYRKPVNDIHCVDKNWI